MKHYQEFEEELNEGLWDMMKGLFGKFMKFIDKQQQKEVTDLAKRLEQNPKGAKDILKKHFNKQYDDYKGKINKSVNIYEVRKHFTDNLLITYDVIERNNDKYLGGSLKFENIFANAGNQTKDFFAKNTANYDAFINGMPKFINNIFLYFGKQVKVDLKSINVKTATEINVDYQNSVKKTGNEEAKPAQGKEGENTAAKPGEETNTTTAAPETTAPAETPTKEGVVIKFEDFINENFNKDLKIENFDNLKEFIANWIDGALRKPIIANIDKSKPGEGGGVTDEDLGKISNAIKGSNNDESKKNLVKSLAKLDAAGLAAVRDVITQKLNMNADEIGKF